MDFSYYYYHYYYYYYVISQNTPILQIFPTYKKADLKKNQVKQVENMTQEQTKK